MFLPISVLTSDLEEKVSQELDVSVALSAIVVRFAQQINRVVNLAGAASKHGANREVAVQKLSVSIDVDRDLAESVEAMVRERIVISNQFDCDSASFAL